MSKIASIAEELVSMALLGIAAIFLGIWLVCYLVTLGVFYRVKTGSWWL